MQRSTHCINASSKMNRPHLNSIDDEEYIDCFAPTYDKVQQPNDANTDDYTIMDHHQEGSMQEDNTMDCTPKDINFPNAKQSVWSTPFIVITVLLFIILILMVAILCMMVAHIASNRTSPDFNEWANGVSQNTLQLFQNTNFNELDKQILQITRDSAQKLTNIIKTLSNLQDTSTSTAGVVDDILLIAQELLVLHNDSTPLPTSCKEIKERQPLSPSGVYLLANNNLTYAAYCNMDELCGSGEGWTRLAYLDMSDATQNCPHGFGLYQSGGVRACGRYNSSVASCVSVTYPSNGISYSQICGRVTGYQFGAPGAVYQPTSSYRSDLNSFYVDGVGITRGSPRQHVWTLMAGYSEASSSISGSCPCNNGSTVSVQSFIGNNYFCESGNHVSGWYATLYTSDPLWDGQGCGSLESPCCNVPGIPWFHRDYGSNTTTDYIELRVCANGLAANEDSPVSYYEIYVK